MHVIFAAHIPSECYYFTLQNGRQCKGISGVLQITQSNTVISTRIEQLTVQNS